MKQSLIFISILLLSNNVCGQDSLAQLTRTWQDLETQLQRRNDLAIVLVSNLIDLKIADSTLLATTKKAAADLKIYIDTAKAFDSLVIKHVLKKSHDLTGLLGRTLATLENYPAQRQNEEVKNLLLHLMGIENRVAVAKRKHNELCEAYNHKELVFEITK
jgi:LemA protein